MVRTLIAILFSNLWQLIDEPIGFPFPTFSQNKFDPLVSSFCSFGSQHLVQKSFRSSTGSNRVPKFILSIFWKEKTQQEFLIKEFRRISSFRLLWSSKTNRTRFCWKRKTENGAFYLSRCQDQPLSLLLR